MGELNFIFLGGFNRYVFYIVFNFWGYVVVFIMISEYDLNVLFGV